MTTTELTEVSPTDTPAGTTTDQPSRPGTWFLRLGAGLLWRLWCLIRGSWRSVTWVCRSKWRLLITAWLLGFFMVGQVGMASADGLIVGPDLGNAGGQTVFERFGPEKWSLFLDLSKTHRGGLHIEESMWTILRAVEAGLMYLIAALARGAITSMEWMLNLTLYSDNRAAIDDAVYAVANQVFWPLFGTTMAIGAMIAYGRMKREGGGSLWNDASWLVAASIFAAMFATAPSLVLKDMDDARTSVGAALMVGYSNVAPVTQSSAGFPAVTLPKDQQGATRQLADGMWNVFVVTPWCYAQFNDPAICKDVGKDYLTNDQRWQDLVSWMDGNNGGNDDDSKAGVAYCPPELNAQCDWIRGQSFGRLGSMLFILIVTVPLVAVLLALVLFGIMAVVGFILLALAGIIFLLFWMIPGRPRQIGVRWLEELIGALLQSIIITTVIGSVMVLDSFLSAGIPKYGFFGVAILDLATFITGWRMRGRLENVVGMGAGSGASPFSGYMAMRAVGALGKSIGKASKSTAGLGTKAGKRSFQAGREMADGMRDSSPLLGGKVAKAGARASERLAPLRNRLTPGQRKAAATTANDRPAKATGGPTRPTGSSGPGSSGPGRSGPARAGRHSAPPADGSTPANGNDSTPTAGGGSPRTPAGGTATTSSNRTGTATAAAARTAGRTGARAERSGGGRQQRGQSTTGQRRGGAGTQASPPVRTGRAPAVRKGQPTISAPDRPDRPLQSRPTPKAAAANRAATNPRQGGPSSPSAPAGGQSSARQSPAGQRSNGSASTNGQSRSGSRATPVPPRARQSPTPPSGRVPTPPVRQQQPRRRPATPPTPPSSPRPRRQPEAGEDK